MPPPLGNTMDTLAEQLLDLDIQEGKLRQALEGIRQRRQKLIQHTLTKSPPATIYSLPDEVLLEIFRYVCALDIDTLRVDGHSCAMTTPNVVLTHICRSWRCLVTESSTLWTTLDFTRREVARTTVERSGMQELDAVRPYYPGTPSLIGLRETLALTYHSLARWRSLVWECNSNDELQWILGFMFSQGDFKNLRTASLLLTRRRDIQQSALERRSHEFPPRWQKQLAQFPSLQELSVYNVLLAQLSPSLFSPSLRTLNIVLSNNNSTMTDAFTVSLFGYLLRPAMKLESMSLLDVSPRWDICLATDKDGPHISISTLANITHSATPPVVGALKLHSLRDLEWTGAPPKHLHKFIRFLDCCNLQSLYVGLYEKLDSIPSSDHTAWCTRLPDRSYPLPHLKKLHISMCDTAALIRASALKTLDLPSLETLTFTCISSKISTCSLQAERRRAAGANDEPSCFPPTDSLFYDPRMTRNLARLEIVGGNISVDKLRSVLAYMTSLEVLSFERCKTVAPVICLLSGADRCRSPLDTPRAWICPRLTTLKLVECNDVKFSCLADTISARKHFSAGVDNQRGRRVMPLPKRILVQGASSPAPSTPRRTRSASKTEAQGTIFSPNGSLVAGWTAHVPVRPSPIEVVYVVNCRRIAEAELMSLRSEAYGLRVASSNC